MKIHITKNIIKTKIALKMCVIDTVRLIKGPPGLGIPLFKYYISLTLEVALTKSYLPQKLNLDTFTQNQIQTHFFILNFCGYTYFIEKYFGIII